MIVKTLIFEKSSFPVLILLNVQVNQLTRMEIAKTERTVLDGYSPGMYKLFYSGSTGKPVQYRLRRNVRPAGQALQATHGQPYRNKTMMRATKPG